MTVSPIRLGRKHYFSAFVRDITDRKRAEDAIARQTQEMTRINAELEDFTHSVSHDLKEPLRGIEAFAGFLAEDYGDKLDEQGQRYVGVLRESAVRMKDLIDDLLQLSRIGRTRYEFATVPILSLVEDVKLELSYAIQEKQADLRLDAALPIVRCDKVRMREVFKNLISNAIKYNDKPTPTDRDRLPLGKRRLHVRRQRQRHRYRTGVPRQDLQDFPAPSPPRGVRRHRRRPGDLQEGR